MVKTFCPACTEKNEKENLERWKWKFCQHCEVDKSFYNVLAMEHKFGGGNTIVFLSNNLIPQIKNLSIKRKAKLGDSKEELIFKNFHYNVRNLDAFKIDAVIQMYEKLMVM